jgi:hypothetical protein
LFVKLEAIWNMLGVGGVSGVSHACLYTLSTIVLVQINLS